jgi:hypothetical protein
MLQVEQLHAESENTKPSQQVFSKKRVVAAEVLELKA